MNHPKYPMEERELPGSVYIPDLDDWAPDDRDMLGAYLYDLQSGKCAFCNEPLCGICDVHECIVTKGDVQSWPDSWKFLINNLFNCVIAHRGCHQHGNREKWWEYKCAIFGEEEMSKWYYSLPFKSPPRSFASIAALGP